MESIKIIEDMTSEIQSVIREENEKYFGALDSFMAEADETYFSSGADVDTETLISTLLNLNSLIYWAGNGLEVVSVKSSLSNVLKNKMYSLQFQKAEGTVKDKEAFAILATEDEETVRLAYQNAVKLFQHKIDKANELASSIKKTISYRMAERARSEQ